MLPCATWGDSLGLLVAFSHFLSVGVSKKFVIKGMSRVVHAGTVILSAFTEKPVDSTFHVSQLSYLRH